MARPFGNKRDLSHTESIVRESMYMLTCLTINATSDIEKKNGNYLFSNKLCYPVRKLH